MSYVEVLCLSSFVAAGHHVRLYSLEPLANVPDGVEVCAARDVYSPQFPVGPRLRHNNAVYSDIFRLELLFSRNEIWVDCDAFCLRPFDRGSAYHIGFEQAAGKTTINTGVLGLPPGSHALAASRAALREVSPVPIFFPGRERRRLAALKAEGRVWGYEHLTWGASGPMLLDHHLRASGEIAHADHPNVFYPGPRPLRKPLLKSPPDLGQIETPETLSVHVYGKTKRFLLQDHDGVPPGRMLAGPCATTPPDRPSGISDPAGQGHARAAADNLTAASASRQAVARMTTQCTVRDLVGAM